LEPAWWPDGEHLVFTSYRDAHAFRDPQAWGLFTAPRDGGAVAKLVTGYLFWASVAPDRAQIAAQGNGSIWLVRLGTKTITRLTGDPGSPVEGFAREPARRP
jgi:Tol biopolymer transport system component